MKLSIVFACFGFLCLMFTLFFEADFGTKEQVMLPPGGGMVGPIDITSRRGVYELYVRNDVDMFQWSYVEVNVLDAKKNYLYSVSDEFWAESGRDSDGRWSESVRDFYVGLTFTEPGQYFLDVKTQHSSSAPQSVFVRLVREAGSQLPFAWLTTIIFIIACLLFYKRNFAGDGNYIGGERSKPLKQRPILLGSLAAVFIVTLVFSVRGYGYMGYYGYHSGPSPFYFGIPSIHYDRNVRQGSVSGAGHRGGGISGGK